MGNGCMRCQEKTQDWCRDTCGCCPCSCCKTVQVEVKSQARLEYVVTKGEIPFGYSMLHAGVRIIDNTYASPILEVHTWRESKSQVSTIDVATRGTVALGGLQTQRDNANRSTNPVRGVTHLKAEVDESTVLIPVESILSIQYSTEIKKGCTETQCIVRDIPRQVEYSCCDRVKNWCHRAFCCCCDGEKPKKQESKPDKIVTTVTDEHAERKIIVTIEYVHYSNIHTPSHIRVLQTSDQAEFYQKRLHSETLKFYLTVSRQTEQDNFHIRQKEAAMLCRLVTQLKSMIGHYPDEQTLEQIVNKRSALTIGEPPTETIQRINPAGSITNVNLRTTPPQHRVIEN